jgi:excisionase family DNA binding protein
MAMNDKLLLDIQSVAERVSLSERMVKELIRTGALRSVKIGARRLVHTADLEEFAAGLREVQR